MYRYIYLYIIIYILSRARASVCVRVRVCARVHGNRSSMYAHLIIEYLSETYQSQLLLFIELSTPILLFFVKYIIPLLSEGTMFVSFHIEDR